MNEQWKSMSMKKNKNPISHRRGEATGDPSGGDGCQ